MSCYPKSQKTYKELERPSDFEHSLDCVCNYLNEYVDFATGKRSSDNDVNKLFEKTKLYAGISLAVEGKRIAGAAGVRISDIRKIRIADSKFYDVKNTVDDARFETDIIDSLCNLLDKALGAKTRLDKVTVIEEYVHMSHEEAPLLGDVCYHYGQKRGDTDNMDIPRDISLEVLDCLAK